MIYLNALNTIDGCGAKKMKTLMNFFGTSEKIWHANLQQLIEAGIREKLARKIMQEKATIDPASEWQKLAAENIQVISIKDSIYPTLLKEIPDHPYLLYLKGNPDCLKLPLVAMVGSRQLTSYGKQVAFGFARDLANNGVCVVSGLAFGVDAQAHSGALDARGKTIAVLGNSLDAANIAPRSNYYLSQEIVNAGGLLLSEYPVPTAANVGTFPMRNRIMAGMSLGTLVVEANEKSGSLITANLALDYNREVFAVPGPINSPQSMGPNQLIKNGAKLICCAQDVLEELKLDQGPLRQEKTAIIELNEQEELIYKVLSSESRHIDIITKLTKLDTSTVSSMLAMLEIKGVIKNVGGQNYIKL